MQPASWRRLTVSSKDSNRWKDFAEKLNIAELKSMDLKNSKNWFEIKQGVVELKEFDHNYKDIALKDRRKT
jgi:hypothetical protein